jgi:hypothetical protein
MPGLNWLDVCDVDFNALLLLEPLHAAYLAQRQPDAAMGTALAAHPAVRWYLAQIHPPIGAYIEAAWPWQPGSPPRRSAGRRSWPCLIRSRTG